MAPSRGIARLSIAPRRNLLPKAQWRPFTQHPPLLSGHNRWSKIKHDKGKNDALKNRQRTLFAQEITTASKLYGADPSLNSALADAITRAKREGFAKASIEAAIARGQGKGASGEKLENVTIEGILPIEGSGNVGVVIECETDRKARTMQELRHVLKEAGGTATPSAYLFEKKGRVVFGGLSANGLETLLDVALDAGAEDVDEGEDGQVTILCEPSDTNAVGEAISKALGLAIKTSEIAWIPIKDTMVELTGNDAAVELDAFMDALQDKEPSVALYSNAA